MCDGLSGVVPVLRVRVPLGQPCEPEVGIPLAPGVRDDVLELTDRNWRVYNNRALIYVLQGRFDDAEADLAKCEELHPRSSTTKVVRQMLLHAKNPVTPVITVDDRRDAAIVEVENE